MQKSRSSLPINSRLMAVLFLGFSSGLPLLLTASTLQAWFTTAGVSIEKIGFLSLVSFPYLYKFLWAPFMDYYVPPFLGRRRAWMFVMQIAIIMSLLMMARLQPQTHLMLMGFVALCIAFFSASQDIAINAYQTDILAPSERGLGAAMTVSGYRVAMLVAGGAALIIAGKWGFSLSYIVMACLMGVGLLTSKFAPSTHDAGLAPKTLRGAITRPFIEFISERPYAIAILAAIVLYKMGDDFVLSLTTTFLLRGLDFTLIEVGSIHKVVGFIATMLGLFIGGALLKKIGLYRSLFGFAIVQMLSSFLFVILALLGKNYTMMVVAVAGEYLSAGMGTSALLAWLMSLCDHRYTATQFALLSALASIGRVLTGPIAGYMVKYLGWVLFYAFGVAAALPGIVLLLFLRKRVFV